LFGEENSMDTIVNPILFKDIDYGVVNYNGTSRRFMVSSGIGYDAKVCESVNTSHIKNILNKVKLGQLSYTIEGVLQMLKLQLISADITLTSGQKMHVNNMIFMSSHITPYEGGGFKFCPDADGTDGFIDVMIAGNISKLKMLMLMPLAKKGKHVNHKGIEIYRCEMAEIKCDEEASIHTDGETLEHTYEAKFSCGQHKIKFIMY